MEATEIKPDLEAINSTIDRINYYSCLPAHIKGIVATLEITEPINDTFYTPAHVVKGSITAICGRINIPDINKISRLYEVDEEPLLIN